MERDVNFEDYKNYYEIGERIGKGSFRSVYKAKSKNSGESFAIKIININIDYLDDVDEETFIKSLINELNSMIICCNKNIYSIKFYEYFWYSKEFVIVMELCDDNLSKVLRNRSKGFETEEIYKIMDQLNELSK